LLCLSIKVDGIAAGRFLIKPDVKYDHIESPYRLTESTSR
jgi:hypothetical protein